MDERPEIVEGSRLPEYFREEVRKSIVNQHARLSETAEFYIVNLLIRFEKTENLFTRRDEHLEDEPLALILAHAVSGGITEQVRELKKLGDTALYISGFFTEHLDRSLVDINYYIDMGSSAYGSLAGVLKKTFAELYGELSQNFLGLATILGEVRLTDRMRTNLDILRLYERWLKTGDGRIGEILKKEGIDIHHKTYHKIFC